jgi:hypothetical protein
MISGSKETCLSIDFGVTIGILKICANNKTVSKEDLRLRQIVAVVNFQKKNR